MRKKKVTRYYCDHCSKGMFKHDAMYRHESVCFKNPNRECFLCGINGSSPPPPGEMIAALESGGLKKLREITDNCPACILAGIIQNRIANPEDDHVSFDYRKERDEMYQRVQSEESGTIGLMDGF